MQGGQAEQQQQRAAEALAELLAAADYMHMPDLHGACAELYGHYAGGPAGDHALGATPLPSHACLCDVEPAPLVGAHRRVAAPLGDFVYVLGPGRALRVDARGGAAPAELRLAAPPGGAGLLAHAVDFAMAADGRELYVRTRNELWAVQLDPEGLREVGRRRLDVPMGLQLRDDIKMQCTDEGLMLFTYSHTAGSLEVRLVPRGAPSARAVWTVRDVGSGAVSAAFDARHRTLYVLVRAWCQQAPNCQASTLTARRLDAGGATSAATAVPLPPALVHAPVRLTGYADGGLVLLDTVAEGAAAADGTGAGTGLFYCHHGAAMPHGEVLLHKVGVHRPAGASIRNVRDATVDARGRLWVLDRDLLRCLHTSLRRPVWINALPDAWAVRCGPGRGLRSALDGALGDPTVRGVVLAQAPALSDAALRALVSFVAADEAPLLAIAGGDEAAATALLVELLLTAGLPGLPAELHGACVRLVLERCRAALAGLDGIVGFLHR